MHKFYLNECLPDEPNQHRFVELFTKILCDFKELIEKDEIKIEKTIITANAPSEMRFGNDYTLLESIEQIADRVLKGWAFSLFDKYPIENHLLVTSEMTENLLSNNYHLEINKGKYDALNLAIAANNEGFIFSIPLCNDLKMNSLELIAENDAPNISANNFYGEEMNIQEIEDRITELNTRNLDNWGRFRVVLRNFTVHYAEKDFEKKFLKLTSIQQTAIIEAFQMAVNYEMRPDDNLIKVTQLNPSVYSVHELRIFYPEAIRVYYHFNGESIYLGGIGFKGSSNQSTDIRNAHNKICKFIQMRR